MIVIPHAFGVDDWICKRCGIKFTNENSTENCEVKN
jgi:hypothetical protein